MTRQRIELAVFLLFIVPGTLLGFFARPRLGAPFPLAAASVILHDLALVGLICYFLWREGEPLARIGWTRSGWWREMLLGVALSVPVFFGANALGTLLRSLGASGGTGHPPAFVPSGGSLLEAVLGVALVAVVALSEETIFRGYLLLRLRAVTPSLAACVGLSSLAFALGHAYEGLAGVITVGVVGAIYATVYLWRRSLVAPIVAHFLQDFLVIVLVPWLRGPG